MEKRGEDEFPNLEISIDNERPLTRSYASHLLALRIRRFQSGLLIRRQANLWIDEASFDAVTAPLAFSPLLDPRLVMLLKLY